MNYFEKYKVTQELFSEDFSFDKLYSNSNTSQVEDIYSVFSKIIPVHAGLEYIRVGGDGDGAYILPDDLSNISALFSPGVNRIKDFEDYLAINYSIKSFMCDYSTDISKLRTPIIDNMQFFQKKWLDVDGSDDSVSLTDWVQQADIDGDLMLQMDIEGAEYRNLLGLPTEILSRFRILVIEFHGLADLNKESFLKGIFDPVIEKISSLFSCVHVHPNNCCNNTRFSDDLVIPNVVEFTFLRKDRLKSTSLKLSLPHALDVNNVPSRPPLHLEGIWLTNVDRMQSELVASNKSLEWYSENYNKLLEGYNHNEIKVMQQEVVASINYIKKEFTNIALDKQASQSSISKYSTSNNDAQGGVNGLKNGKFGFHTETELNPWWCVDLLDIYKITAIVIYNRVDCCSKRCSTLKLFVSLDGECWRLVYDHKNKMPFGGVKNIQGKGPLLIPMYSSEVRYVRIELSGEVPLHLDEIEIYA